MGLLVDRVVASYYQTNCWIVAPRSGSHCLVVDPGIDLPDMRRRLHEKLDEHNLRIGAIMITHGHLDHTFSLFPIAHEFGISSVYVHVKDRDLLSHPERALSPQSMAMFREMLSKFPETRIEEPEGTISLEGSERLQLDGMELQIVHTPGHTPGSIIGIIDNEIVATGDTLFAGSIGRTDLPRGSISDMEESLREKIAVLPEHLGVLPGHGEQTRMERELKANPFLKQAIERRLA